MTRTTDATMDTVLDSGRLPLAWGIRIARRDSTTHLLVAHDKDIVANVGFGSETYKAYLGADLTALATSATFQADNLEASGILDAAGITEADIRDRRFDGADVYVFAVNWEDPSSYIKYNRYTVGDSRSDELGYKVELRSLIDYLNARLLITENVWCDTPFMGTRCGAVKDPPTWAATTAYGAAGTGDDPRNAGNRDHVKPTTYNDRFFRVKEGGGGTSGGSEPSWNTTIGGETVDGTVTWITERARFIQTTVASFTDRRTFRIAAATDAPDDLLNEGLVTATSGNNNGSRPLEIADWILSTKEIVLAEGFARDLQIGDSVEITLPCNKTIETGTLNCQFYANVERFVGWPHKPGDQALIRP